MDIERVKCLINELEAQMTGSGGDTYQLIIAKKISKMLMDEVRKDTPQIAEKV